MRRLLLAIILSVAGGVAHSFVVQALSSDPKQFISADNTFYAYVKGGETISAAFLRVNQEEPFDTVRGDVTITLDGPGVPQQKCVAPKDVPIGQGCNFAPQTAPQTGIWRVQFSVPADARTYQEVSPVVRWTKNLFNWSVTVKNSDGEQHGRVWTERYAIRQPAPASYLDDFVYYYISEDGYIYKATETGYNGQISTLSADGIGIRSGKDCVSAYQSTEVSDTKFSPALGTCGNAYKLFFEEPAGDLPAKAKRWDGTNDWIRPNISRPSIAELHFSSDNSSDQQSGYISFYLRNFIGQYQIKIDTDGDGSFDGQSDVLMNEQMKSLSSGLQRIRFSGVDKYGQIIPTSQIIGIQVVITKVAEIHLVAADVEGRTGGLELIRESGDNAPTTRLCWNDTELTPLTTGLMTKTLDGRNCPDSVGGIHGWAYNDSSWGNARYIDDWIYASAKLTGNNQITYPNAEQAATKRASINWLLISGIGAVILLVLTVAVIVLRKRHRARQQIVPQDSPTIQQVVPTDTGGEPPHTEEF
jgi:hypothetical protein